MSCPRPGNHHATEPAWGFRFLRRSSRPRSRRCWRTGCSSTPNVQPRVHSMKPTFASPTSTATSARCRSSNGWVNTLSIRMETTVTTTARKLGSGPTQRCPSIQAGQDIPAHADRFGLASRSSESAHVRSSSSVPHDSMNERARATVRSLRRPILARPAPSCADDNDRLRLSSKPPCPNKAGKKDSTDRCPQPSLRAVRHAIVQPHHAPASAMPILSQMVQDTIAA
jgi:hypothetical protein